MTRQEKIDFLLWAVMEIEGVRLSRDYYDNYSDIAIEQECERLDYLLDK